MSTFQIVLLVLGIVVGLILRTYRSQPPQSPRRVRQSDNLDTVDEMYLFGEVTDDEFYRM